MRTFRTNLLLGLFAASFILAGYQLRLGPLVVYPPELLIYPLLVVCLVQPDTRRKILLTWHNLSWSVKASLAMVLLGGAVGAVISLIFPVSLGAFKAWVFLPMALFLLVLTFAKEEKFAQTMPQILVVMALIISLIGLADFFHAGGRLRGYFDSPNLFAAMVGPIFIVGLAAWEQLTPRFAFGLMLAVIGMALLLSQSVGGLLAVGLTTAVLLLTRTSLLRRKLSWLLIVLATAVVLLAWQRLSNGADNSWASRIEIWRVSFYLIGHHPVWGVGLRGFASYYGQSATAILGHAPIDPGVTLPHNLILAVWTGLGLPGLIGLGYLTWLALRRADLHSPYILALICILIHGLVDTPYFQTDLVLAFWLYLGITYNRVQNLTLEPRG